MTNLGKFPRRISRVRSAAGDRKAFELAGILNSGKWEGGKGPPAD
jgi:hypothetical protein